MAETIFNVSIKATFGYFLLLLLIRITGRKMISQMTFFDFVVGVTVGTITGSLILGSSTTTIKASTSLIILTLLTILTGYLQIKSFFIRKVVNSEPVILLEKGKIINENLKKVRLTLNELMMQLREKNIFNISDVDYAIFEINGQLSVLPKPQKKPLTPSDLNLATPNSENLTKDIIVDGNIMYENLHNANRSEEWLNKQLQAQNINSPQEIFYAGLTPEGILYLSRKTNTSEKQGQHGIE